MATVGLVYNLARSEQPEEGEPPDSQAEYDGEGTVLAVAEALRNGGHDVVFIEGDVSCLDRLLQYKPDIVFNMAEGLRGESRESHVPALLEMLGIPYTGSGVLALALSLDKPAAKKVFTYHGVATPRFRVFRPGEPLDIGNLRFPLFAKPAHEGSSMGITPDAIIRNYDDLRRCVENLGHCYRQEVLVEEYLCGREFTVAILGNDEPRVFSPMEINFQYCPSEHGAIYSRHFKVEWSADKYYTCPALVSDELDRELRELAVRAFHALGCRDVARVDIRLDHNGVPHVLEINPLPGLAPGFSDLPRIVAADGLGYQELVLGILDCALQRCGRVDLCLPVLARSIA
jgi:D-alanine-D-alanine ligase